MKQLGLAFEQYTQDNDDEFPRGHGLAGQGWAGQVYSYVKTKDFYHCPDDAQSDPYVSYAENYHLARQKLAALTDPALTVQLYEDTTLNCDPSTAEVVSSTGLSAPQDSKRHNDTNFLLNFLFVDGHVKWLLPGAVSSGPNAVKPTQIKQSRNGPYVATFAIK